MARARIQASRLTDPAANEILARAAAAVGLTPQDLIALATDAGAVTAARHSAIGAVSTLTIGDVGDRMHAEICKVAPQDRRQWFSQLLDAQKSALIIALRDKGWRTEVVAHELGIEPSEVSKTFSRYADLIGADVVSVRLNTIAGQVQLAAERAQQGLMEKDDWKGYWGVAKDMVDLLQSLGIVDRAIHKVEVTHKFDEQKKAELSAILELERKKIARNEELKLAEFSVSDPLPESS